MFRRIKRTLLFQSFLLVCICTTNAADQSNKLRYNRDIRPILSENCFRCHGPDKNQRKKNLRLDVRESALEKEAIVPGKPERSLLIERIFSTDSDEVMPPASVHKPLSSEQKEILKRWITEGADYEPHWAYITPLRPSVPKTKNAKWVKNSIDAFVLHSLEEKKFQPSAEADKRTLLRRLSLDLIGLPPTPNELEQFVNDKSPRAYEKQVDRLLASPHFGERMASPWLDAVRFTDTVGYHGDQVQRIFPYRDYVINSFNRNKPFDQFTIEQIAGDLLPHATTEQKIASGFNRLNMMTREGGAQPKEYLAKSAADRVRTISGAWLGSTMGCCECHDHKYDPFSTKDFYSMEAFFADLKQWGYYADAKYTPNPELKGFSNESPFPPEMEVRSPYLERHLKKTQDKLEKIYADAASMLQTNAKEKIQFENWRQESEKFFAKNPSGWLMPEPKVRLLKKDSDTALSSTNAILKADRSIVLKGKPTDIEVTLPLEDISLAALRVELLPSPEHKGKMIRDTEGENPDEESEDKPESTLVTFSAKLKLPGATNSTSLTFYDAEADRKEDRFSGDVALLGVKDKWKTSADHYKAAQTAVWMLSKPTKVKAGSTLTLKFKNNKVGCMRVSISPFALAHPLQLTGLNEELPMPKSLASREPDPKQPTNTKNFSSLAKALKRKVFLSRSDRELLNEVFFWSTAWNSEAFSSAQKIQTEIRLFHEGRAFTMVSIPIEKPLTIRVLPRGNWQNESGEIVQPTAPHFLPQIPNPEKRRLTRLDLAKWLVSKENPLTSRTIMNRLWKQFFGTGISAVVDDLGAQGETPVHPELLDWLAVEFRESGWDFKHMVKLIAMSSTYRQQSNLRPEMRDVDPANRLLSCQSPRRLDAEAVRDNALTISGLINLEMGGPSVKPYQPAGYYANLQFPERDYIADKDERQYRRGVYMHWQRTFLHPMLANFDAPAREESTCTRNLSNTPQQALTLMNDPSFVEAARVFAQKLLLEPANSNEERLNLAFEQALCRPIKPEEKKSLEKFLSEQRKHHEVNWEEAEKLLKVGLAPREKDLNQIEVAAWTQVCRVIFNLHETITKF